jgi:hypothetical protein
VHVQFQGFWRQPTPRARFDCLTSSEARSQKIQARCGRSGKFVRPHKAPDSTRTGLEVIDLLAISSTRRWASWLYSWNMIVDSINQVFPATMAGTGPPSGAK